MRNWPGRDAVKKRVDVARLLGPYLIVVFRTEYQRQDHEQQQRGEKQHFAPLPKEKNDGVETPRSWIYALLAGNGPGQRTTMLQEAWERSGKGVEAENFSKTPAWPVPAWGSEWG